MRLDKYMFEDDSKLSKKEKEKKHLGEPKPPMAEPGESFSKDDDENDEDEYFSDIETKAPETQEKPKLDKEYKDLLSYLDFEPTPIDMVVSRSGLTAKEVSSMLLVLELDGIVNKAPGRYFRPGRN